MSLTVTISQFSGGVSEYNNPTLRGTANYLIWLCGKYALEARKIIGIGGGGTVIPPPSGLTVNRIDFIVSASSYLVTGTTTATLTTFIGYNLDFIRGGISQSTVDTEVSYFTYNPSSGAFTCFPALVEGELIALIPG